jgi:pyridoxal 5'-phosphate synthase pdxT subunit
MQHWLLLQALVGGLDVEICRNYFGAQISSFEQPIDTTALDETLESETAAAAAGSHSASTPYPAIFIRAPAILSVCT